MADLLSPCCGAEYTDNEDGPSYCCDAPLTQGLCSECKEHAEPQEGFICEECDEFFEEPEVDYEYAAKMHDSYLEDRMDEERLEKTN
jgi:hypothetical protein|tara:strand:- start:55 stop:315 length:261 start_codon:yes stop_codon:yes gene_type:complete